MSRCLRMMVVLTWIFLLSSGTAISTGRPEQPAEALIPDNLIVPGAGEKKETVILVEKASQRLFLYSLDDVWRQEMSVACSTGEVNGAKTSSGDKKTPEGVYFFLQSHEKKYLSAVYGDRAFPMDYPNFMDRRQQRKGNSIWMHGTNKPIKPMNSNGCIVLDNGDINALSPFVTLNRTPIIVVEKLAYVPAGQSRLIGEQLTDFLRQWNRAVSSGTYQEYLSFYDPEYLPEISWWPAWSITRKRLAEDGKSPVVEWERPILVKERDVYVALFEQTVTTGEQRIPVGTRKLFISRNHDRFRIIGDEFQPGIQEPPPKSDYPLLAACLAMEPKPKSAPEPVTEKKPVIDTKQEIAGLIDDWLHAWASKDMDRYGSHYSKGFRAEGMNRDDWLKYKRQLSRKYRYIKISKKNLSIDRGDTTTVASFIQTYESSGYKAVGRKSLFLKREGGRWKIFRETWKRM